MLGCGGGNQSAATSNPAGENAATQPEGDSAGPATGDFPLNGPPPGASPKPRAAPSWAEVREFIPSDIPLPEDGKPIQIEELYGRKRVEFVSAGQSIDDLMAIFDKLPDNGWVPLTENMKTRVNEKLANYTYNKGPLQVGISIVQGDESAKEVTVIVTIGQDPQYKPPQ